MLESPIEDVTDDFLGHIPEGLRKKVDSVLKCPEGLFRNAGYLMELADGYSYMGMCSLPCRSYEDMAERLADAKGGDAE